MNYKITYACALIMATFIGTAHAQQQSSIEKRNPTFEFWNKTNQPLYISVGDLQNNPEQIPMLRLDSNKYYSLLRDIKQPTYLLISDEPRITAKKTWKYYINPNKTIYVRMKKEGNAFIFGPQTGPWMGFLKKTERGYPLSNNVTQGDMKQVKIWSLDDGN